MAKNKISEWSSTAASNTDIGGIDIAEGCAPSGINNAIREMMAQVKDMQAGTDADNFTVGGNLSVTGTTTLTGAVTATAGVTGNLTGNVTGNVSGTSANVTGTVAIANGGTGATTAANAFAALKQDATDTSTGAVELLTTAEHTAGTDTTRALTSAVARAANIVLDTAKTTTSGTSIDFTDIPSWVKRITVMWSGISTNGTSTILIQIGNSGGIENTGYAGGLYYTFDGGTNNVSNPTAGFSIQQNNASGNTYHGQATLSLLNPLTNTWALSGLSSPTTSSTNARISLSTGTKSLSATLNSVRITTAGGTDTFDAGSINIMYE